jgi:uncharacterized protein with HEPN domain
MSDDRPRDPKGVSSGGRFRPRENPESGVVLDQEEDSELSRAEDKAVRNLGKTLEALRSSLDKGKKLVEMGRQRFDEDWIFQDAACITVIQLAEEAKRLPSSFREEREEIPWRKLIGMRNILTHEYSDVDISIVWGVLEDSFPEIERCVFPDD